MENPIKLPSGRIAYKQTNEDAYTIYGADNTTFIACLPAEDIEMLSTQHKESPKCSTCDEKGVLVSVNGYWLCDECNIKEIDASQTMAAIWNGTAIFKDLF